MDRKERRIYDNRQSSHVKLWDGLCSYKYLKRRSPDPFFIIQVKGMEEYTSRNIRLSKERFTPVSHLTNGQEIIFQNRRRILYTKKENGNLHFPSDEKLRLQMKYGSK